jgi:signal transduction histidine kinase
MSPLRTIIAEKYADADPMTRVKATYVFYFYVTLLIFIPVLAAYTIYVNLHDATVGNRVQYQLVAAELFLYISCIASTVLIVRGHYKLSTHLLLAITMLSVWTVIFFDSSATIIRLDTIVFVLAILSISSFIVTRRGLLILAYGGINLAIFFLFIFYFRDDFGLSHDAFLDYAADSSIAMVFIIITQFGLFMINRKALESVEKELADRKRTEEERKHLEMELFQAKKMESIGRLAGGVAHDFNNLLMAIMGNVGCLLNEKNAGEKDHERLTVIMQASESAADLTGQLLAFSRKQFIAPVLIDVNSLLERMEKVLAQLIGESITLRIVLHPGICPIRVDASQMEQIIINLAVNARDAMPDGGTITFETAAVTITEEQVKLHPDAVPGEYAVLSVNDNGSGMTDEVREHIFEPFYTTKPNGKGTGLGLAIVYGAVRQNGGFLEVLSAPGRGTTFRIYFPDAGRDSRRE